MTVQPKATPTPAAPTVSVSGPDSCYPYPSCGAVITASGSNYDSLSWSGCCSGNRTTATCSFADLATHTCTVTATGPGGSATASKAVKGVNVAPVVSYVGNNVGTSPLPCNTAVSVTFKITDEESRVYACQPATVQGPPTCAYDSIVCPVSGSPSYVEVHMNTLDHHQGVLCYVGLQVVDRFGALSNVSSPGLEVAACP